LGANTLIKAKPIVTNVLVLMILGQNLYKCFKSLKSIHWPITNIFKHYKDSFFLEDYFNISYIIVWCSIFLHQFFKNISMKNIHSKWPMWLLLSHLHPCPLWIMSKLGRVIHNKMNHTQLLFQKHRNKELTEGKNVCNAVIAQNLCFNYIIKFYNKFV